MSKLISVVALAGICHEANRALCEAVGETSQKPWNEAPDWQKESVVSDVLFRLNNPMAPVSAQHEQWSEQKIADGWKYGETKDAEAKTHPCLVPFAELPTEQRAKDFLFCSIVGSLRGIVEPGSASREPTPPVDPSGTIESAAPSETCGACESAAPSETCGACESTPPPATE